jgi:DNA-entry nuclease
VQPGIDIDYKTGDNRLSEDTEMLEDYQAGKYTVRANTLGYIPSGQAQSAASGEKDNSEDADKAEPSEPDEQKMTYVLNTNTGKFHYPDCRSVTDMNDRNKKEIEATRDDLINRGFSPCSNCNP